MERADVQCDADGVRARDRIARFLAERDQAVDADTLHTRKTSRGRALGAAGALGFDLVTSAHVSGAPKPDPALCCYALAKLCLTAGDVLATEDNRAGVDAAKAAGITVLAWPALVGQQLSD